VIFENKEIKVKNQEAVMLIKLSMVDDNAFKCAICGRYREVHKTFDKGRVFYLKHTFLLKMEEGDSLSEHLLKMTDIHDKLLAIGREVMEYNVVVVTLKSIPPSFEKCVETLNVAPESTDIYFEKLCIESR
jgi:hypothetical protein